MNLTTLQTKSIALNDLLLLAKGFAGTGFASLVHVGKPSQVKTGSPSPGTIIKKSNVLVNWGSWRYGSALEAQAKREGKEIQFEIKPRKWGKRIFGTPLVHHIDKNQIEKWYIEAKVEKVLSPATYSCDITGKDFHLDEVKPYLNSYRNPKSESSTQDGLTKKIYLRDYALTGIVEMNHQKTKYILK
jgi:hypothetical protein